MTPPVVIHYLRSYATERAACGRYIINCTRYTQTAEKVTCRACLTAMAQPAISNKESTNA